MQTVIHLSQKTKKGKEVIKRDGSCWVIHALKNEVAFSPRKGPFALIAPLGCSKNHRASRWIHLADDANFDWE